MEILRLLDEPLIRGLAGIVGAAVLVVLAAIRWKEEGDDDAAGGAGLD
jgi:hypothetical protein